MPYSNLKDLPENIRANLPQHAQEIYLAAFNNAWDEYSHDEERAYRVAWSAVKKNYVKDKSKGEWIAKDKDIKA